MSQTLDGRSESREVSAEGLFHLATELDAGVEAFRRRLEEKEQMLMSAGVIFPGESPWRDRWAEIMMLADQGGTGNYGDIPVGPTGDCDGSPGSPCRRGQAGGAT